MTGDEDERERKRRQRTKNLAMLAVLAGVAILFYLIAMVKFGGGQ